MSDINTIKTKLDTDNQKGVISEKEFNDNFGKLDQTDYKKISEGLETKDQQFLNLLQKPIFENLQKKDLLNKQSLSVNEIKTVKLFFMSYGMNANRSGERQKSNDQKMAEMYMNEKGIWYGLGQDGWNEFKKGFKGHIFFNYANMFNLNKSKGKDITYPAGPININHPDIKRLNGEGLQVTQQIEKVQRDNYNKIQQNMKDIENKEIATRPLSKKLEELKNKNTLDVLDELTSAPNGILYNDNIKEMTYNEKEKIQKIIENVFSNPSVNSTQVMDYVWKFHCSLGDEKRSNKTGEKVEGLTIRTNNQVGMRIEIINTCYQLAQAKGFGELQSKPETAKRSLVKLCNILTGRFNSTGKGRMMQEDRDKKFNNPELARGILESLMQINGTIDKISPVDVLKDEPSLKNKECGSFVAEISQNIPRPLSGEFGILEIVSVDEKTKISQLSATLQARTIVLKKISEKIKSDKKQIPFESSYIQELKNLGTNEAKAQQTKFETQKKKFKEEIKKVDFWTSGFKKSAQEYGLQGADTDIFNLYRDFAVNSFWAGQLSDEVDDQIMGYAKMGAMIGGTIVTMMIFPPAGVGYLGSAIAVGVTSTVLTQMLYKKLDYDSFTEGAVDIGSQFVFDTATAFLGMKVFGPFIQKTPGFFNNVKNITSNVGITLFDVTIGSTAEGIRQIGYNELFDKQEKVDILQMIRTGGVMATVFLMVSGGFHVKLPVEDMLRHLKANDPKLNPTGFKNLKISEIDYQNSIKLLELKSNALADVDVQTGGNKREILKDQIAKGKKIENNGDITIPKGKLEAPVEKKLSPEVEKLYIETIDRIDDITQQIIDGKVPERDGTESMLLKIIGDPAKTKYHYLKRQLSYEDQVTLNDNLSKFAKEFTILNQVNNKIKTSNDWLEKFKITGLSLDFAVDKYGNIIHKGSGSILQKEDFYIEWENPTNLTVGLTNKAADIFLGPGVAGAMNKMGKFNKERFNIEYVRVERNPAGEYKPIEIGTVIHERQHSIYDVFFSQSDIKEIASKYRKLKDKTKIELSESIKSIKEENINSFVNETLKSGNESVMELSVDEILAYKKDGTEAVNIFENLTETNDYNYTLELNDFLKSEFLARNVDISETINKFTHKKIEIIAELVNLSQYASIEELSMTPYKERYKFDKTGNTKKSDLEF